MKKTILKCDRCGVESEQVEGQTPTTSSFNLTFNGKSVDAGDLCHPCTLRVRKDFHDLILNKPVSVGEFTVVRKERPE